MGVASGCLRAQLDLQHYLMVLWCDWQTVGVFCCLASKVASTPWVVAAPLTGSSSRQVGPECPAALPDLLRVLGPSDTLAKRPEKRT